jgi:hypothetical protein
MGTPQYKRSKSHSNTRLNGFLSFYTEGSLSFNNLYYNLKISFLYIIY